MKKETTKTEKNVAVECARDCVCQTEGGAPCCKITEVVNDTIFFTESRHPDGCDRQYSFGSTFICTCPVRHDLYRMKKI